MSSQECIDSQGSGGSRLQPAGLRALQVCAWQVCVPEAGKFEEQSAARLRGIAGLERAVASLRAGAKALAASTRRRNGAIASTRGTVTSRRLEPATGSVTTPLQVGTFLQVPC